MSNGVKVDGEYINDPRHRKNWQGPITRISQVQASALLECAGKFSENSSRTAEYLFINKGFVILPMNEYGEQLAVYLHDVTFFTGALLFNSSLGEL